MRSGLNVKRFAFAFLVASFLGAVEIPSTILAKMSVETSKPKPVDPEIDNSQVRSSLITTLVLTFDIRDTEVMFSRMMVVMAPRPHERRKENADLILVNGTRNGQRVSSIRIPDERVNVEEKKGLVIMKNRTIIAMLPLPVLIDHVEITLPFVDKAISFDVRKALNEFCKTQSQLPLCHS